MTSKCRITVNIKKEDVDLFQEALKKYDIGKSELIGELIHTWLFNNKLHFDKKSGGKNGKQKR